MFIYIAMRIFASGAEIFGIATMNINICCTKTVWLITHVFKSVKNIKTSSKYII